jgi:DNA repair protein RecO (recombination protein O)
MQLIAFVCKSGCKITVFFLFYQILFKKNIRKWHFLCIFVPMLTKTEAIVLHSFKYGEQKCIVDMFTRQHGRLSFIVTLPKSPHGRLKKQYFQPLTLLNIECDLRVQAQLQKLRDASIAHPLPSLASEPAKLAIGLFAAEFLYHALKGEQQGGALFDYITSSIQWLDSQSRHYANFHLVFLMHLSRFLGFYPNLDDYHPNDYFDLRASTFCQAPPLHRDFLMPHEASVIRLLMRMDFATMHLFHMNREQRNRCLEVALTYYRIHLPAFPELRSLAVLHQLFE